MGSSTVTLQDVIDTAVASGAPNPLNAPAGYGMKLALEIGNTVVGDFISQRFNWKWNSGVAAPFYTNSWQQDYPQLGNANIGWLEDADRIDINNTMTPKPLWNLTVRRQLSRANVGAWPLDQICWLYNSEMSYGTWPGAGVTFYPLVGAGAPAAQNPIMSMIDANGNLLIVTTFGTTGNIAPHLDAGAPEGQTFIDGTVTWTCVSPTSKGFRVFPPPGATGPTWMIVPKFQNTPPRFTDLEQTLDPIPDDYERHFRSLYRIGCFAKSANPADRQLAKTDLVDYLKSLDDAKKQGNREQDAYALLPASSPVEPVYPYLRNPLDPSQPY